jgi:hypothetical protein
MVSEEYKFMQPHAKLNFPGGISLDLEGYSNEDLLDLAIRASKRSDSPQAKMDSGPSDVEKPSPAKAAMDPVGPNSPGKLSIKKSIEKSPSCRHSISSIQLDLVGKTIPTRIGERSNPRYSRWVQDIKRARKEIELETGGSFDIVEQGKGVKVYELKPAPGGFEAR